MAIIKCPECGRQISDKAPVCPNCGVEIAGKIIKCTQCGDVYFSNQEMCPNCHQPTYLSKQTVTPPPTEPRTTTQPASQTAPQPTVVPPAGPASAGNGSGNTPPPSLNKKKNATPFIVALLLALAICGGLFYFYNNAKASKEAEAYEFAMRSDDPLVLQTYLDNNIDAPQEHRDSIMARIEFLKKQDNDWSNALVSGSRYALEDYIAKHPDSEHVPEAKQKIDSLDWTDAMNENTLEAVERYLSQHANGEHVDEATALMKELKAKTVQQDDKNLVVTSLRRFFQSINSRNEEQLLSSVTPLLSNFLGKADATKSDVVTFMNKIYKDDITNMNWKLNGDYKIEKKEIGDEQYEYNVAFSAVQDIDRTDDSKEKEARYLIKAKINPDGLISSMTMTKILE